jgi:hypothetical protein
MSVRAVLLVLAFVAAEDATAQSVSLDGTWIVTWEVGIGKREDGATEVTRRAESVLVLVQHGDSLSGTWQPPRAGDTDPHPWTHTRREIELQHS